MTSKPATLPQGRSFNGFGKRIAVVMLGALALAGVAGSPASALPRIGVTLPGGGRVLPPPDPCLSGPQILSFAPTSPSIDLGTSTILNWSVQAPSGCAYAYSMTVSARPQNDLTPNAPADWNSWTSSTTVAAQPQGTLQVQPAFNTVYLLVLAWGPNSWTFHTTQVAVNLPVDVTINANDLAPLLVQAMETPNTTVIVPDGIELDLTPRVGTITIAKGVQLIGGRQATPGTPYQPGPRLFTTTAPSAEYLFSTEGDNVRITGVRLEGPGPVLGATSAINIDPGPNTSTVSIEIDHNEIFNWNMRGVDIHGNGKILVSVGFDNRVTPAELAYFVNPTTEPVWIHDNYIHNNYDGNPVHFGYGVVLGNGGHALIERNVFNAHWHAIAGDGTALTGYRAYRNLVLETGYRTQGVDHGEQSFDMHARRDGSGAAGRDIDIRFNAFLYTDGPAINLRGTPDIGDVVESNVFAHSSLSDAVWWVGNGVTEGNSCLGALPSSSCGPRDNKVGVTMWDHTNSCDFDGDGINDDFIATGETLWYRSGDISKGATPWIYLNTYPKHLNEFSLGYFSGRHVCDVVDSGWKLVGGTGSWVPLTPLTIRGILSVSPTAGAK